MVGGADPDRHGALVFGVLTDERRQRLPGYSDRVFSVVYQECLDFDPASLSSLQRLVERVSRAPRGPVAVEAVLRGGPAGNVRGIVLGVLVAQGQAVSEAPVRNRAAWWQTGRVRLPGENEIVAAMETSRRWIVGLDLAAAHGREGTDSRAKHKAGLLQAACIARWHALKLAGEL